MVTTLLAADGDTWGIGGPTFVVLYLLAILVLVGAAVLDRRAVRREPGRLPARGWDRDPYHVAYLNEGPQLALTTALGALHLDGKIAAQGRSLTRVGKPDPTGRPTLERAILLSSAAAVTRPALTRAPAVAAELAGIGSGLVDRGLLLSGGQLKRLRRWGRWMMLLVAVGGLRLVSGLVGGKPVWYLVLLLVVGIVAAVALGRKPPRRTALGDRELARLRIEHQALAPGLRPDWVTGGAVVAGMAVAVFGAEALWAAEPAFAGEVMAQEALARAAGASSGGSGHTSSSGCSGGSSCGGGSGGSGGGGGCGGGGCGG